MATIKAHSRPDTPFSGPPPNRTNARTAGLPPPWQGHITEPRCHQCSWSYLDGVVMIKYINRICPDHGRLLPH